MGVSELAPLTFRALTLPFAAICMLAFARLSGDSMRIPRAFWPHLGALALGQAAGQKADHAAEITEYTGGRSDRRGSRPRPIDPTSLSAAHAKASLR